MTRIREIPYNYTSFSDREITLRLLGTRPDVSTQVRFSKDESLRKSMKDLNAEKVKVLTSCPSCLQGLARFEDDTGAQADYIVVELARRLLGENWLPEFVNKANAGGIERVLL